MLADLKLSLAVITLCGILSMGSNPAIFLKIAQMIHKSVFPNVYSDDECDLLSYEEINNILIFKQSRLTV